jgi:hypothetical protein
MSIKDLESFSIAFPHYRFNPNASIISTLYALNVPVDRQIWTNSSDVRICRNFAVGEFFKPMHFNNDVLIMCDQDSKIEPYMIEQLVIACSESSPIIGSNMIYRNSKDGFDVNWFFENDEQGIKRSEILQNPHQFADVIDVDLIGFGLVALHRTALDKMIAKFGVCFQAGHMSPILFSEYKQKTPHVDKSRIEESLKAQLKPEYIDDAKWSMLWEDLLKEQVLFSYNNKFPDVIHPETYSFCLRAKELNLPIRVYLGVRPGHLEEKPSYSMFPQRPPSKLNSLAYEIQSAKEKSILQEIEL